MKRVAIAACLALALVVAGCAGAARHSSSHRRPASGARAAHAPLRVTEGAPAGIGLLKGARILSPTALGIVTVGSGGCPPTPHRLIVRSRHTIRIDLARDIPANGVCTADLTTTPWVIAIDPKRIDVHHRLTLHIYYPGATTALTRTAPPLAGNGLSHANDHYSVGRVVRAFAGAGARLRNVSPKDYAGLLALLDGRPSHEIYVYVVNGFKGALRPAIRHASATHHGNVEVLWRPGERALVRAALHRLG